MRICIALALVCFLLPAAPVLAQQNSGDVQRKGEAGFNAWKDIAAKRARAEGISDALLQKTLYQAEYLPRVIELDNKQPYKTMTFDQYVDRVIPASRINTGRARLQENLALLNATEKRFGVQKRFIVALWGIESDFGRNTGGFKIIDALATLAYDGRRGEFFTSELMAALKILKEGHITPEKMKGSWAGAMGQTQFMPSSFLRLSADGDGDGKRDIWTNKADIFASIANYLHKTGWDDNRTWGREVRASGVPSSLFGKDVKKSLSGWQRAGVRNLQGGPLPDVPGIRASLIRPGKDGDRVFLVYDNFRHILKWNRSDYFATSVGLFSDALK